MKALIGLGNPGPEYEMTRHNVGFLALDEAARQLGLACTRKQFSGLVGEGRLGGHKIVIFKPGTYMNLSGRAFVSLMHWYKLKPEDILVFSDDIDLAPGLMRLRAGGGAGTHNGWRSILQETGERDFARARIGIGPPPPAWDLADWVLSRWDKDEQAKGIAEAIHLAAKAGVSFLKDGIQLTMNLYNTKSRIKKETIKEEEKTSEPDA